MIGLIYLPGIDDEVPTPPDGVREKRPVFLRVDVLTSTNGIVKIELSGFLCPLQKFLVRYLRPPPDAINVDDALDWVWIGAKRNGIYARWQEGTSALDSLTEWLHRLAVVQHDDVKLFENAQKVAMFGDIVYPKFVQ
jgi:hypothetical protein